MGGLTAAAILAAKGAEVTVVEKALKPGGKIRQIDVGGAPVDSGPTVFTMRWMFEDIFAAAGDDLDRRLTLKPAEILARHAWAPGAELDLFADKNRSADAIAAFAGPEEGKRYLEFCARGQWLYETLEGPFLRSPRPNLLVPLRERGWRGLIDLMNLQPYGTMWQSLGHYFHDPRLRQLFGRYATYCGSSPFAASATLMLIAHVEQEGVWLVDGGMQSVAEVLAALATRHGATFRYGTEAARITIANGKTKGVVLADGEELEAEAVLFNGDVAALANGFLGDGPRNAVSAPPASARSLSAITWSMLAQTDGFPLIRHTVFFSDDYPAEFDDLIRDKRLPRDPTVYVCAHDRDDLGALPVDGPERLLCLVNAPPTGDGQAPSPEEIAQCEERTFQSLERRGLRIHRQPETTVRTTPVEFNRLFPATGGALYGRSSHGWRASFQRPTARSRLPGLYLAGGSTHPGAGVPMAAFSGYLAAHRLMADLASTGWSRPVAMSGGTSTE